MNTLLIIALWACIAANIAMTVLGFYRARELRRKLRECSHDYRPIKAQPQGGGMGALFMGGMTILLSRCSLCGDNRTEGYSGNWTLEDFERVPTAAELSELYGKDASADGHLGATEK